MVTRGNSETNSSGPCDLTITNSVYLSRVQCHQCLAEVNKATGFTSSKSLSKE